MKLARRFVMLAMATALLLPALAVADTITGTGDFASFSADLTYDPTNATLTVELTNTSDSGFLTGFALNNPGSITGVDLTQAPSGWELLFGDIDGDPFGTFDFGAAIDQNFLGGGSPSDGLAAGETATFVFTFTGTGLDALTLQSFYDALSTGGSQSAFFLARFRGIGENDESDKVPGVPGENPPPVPEPATMLMMGTGLTALAGVIRRKRQAKN